MDVIVSPMVSHNPASTNVGKALVSVVGPELTAKFQKEAGGATLPGETVIVEGLPGLKCKTVVFLNLNRWDNAQDGNSVQVKYVILWFCAIILTLKSFQNYNKQLCSFQELRQGIRKILASCKIRGFSSVAFPVLGTGALLAFPHRLASSVLLEEVRAFEQNQITKTPFLVYIVVHPKDKESSKVRKMSMHLLIYKMYRILIYTLESSCSLHRRIVLSMFVVHVIQQVSFFNPLCCNFMDLFKLELGKN